MLFTKIFLVFSTAVSAALIVDRSATSILSDLQTVDQDVNALTNSVNNWDGTLGGAVAINNAEQTLESQLNKTTTDISKEPSSFTCADSNKIISYLVNTVEPDVKKLVQALINKKPQFTNVGLKNVIRDSLTRLRQEFAALLKALCGVICPSYSNQCKTVATKIDNDFSQAQATFAS